MKELWLLTLLLIAESAFSNTPAPLVFHKKNDATEKFSAPPPHSEIPSATGAQPSDAQPIEVRDEIPASLAQPQSSDLATNESSGLLVFRSHKESTELAEAPPVPSVPAGVQSVEDADLSALSLSSSEPTVAPQVSPWQLSVEGGAGKMTSADKHPSLQRLSADFRLEKKIGEHLTAILSDRLDSRWQDNFQDRHSINTLRDGYFSWRPQSSTIIDLGRINQYTGVALGYNPTDYFREGALRSLVSVDPTSIKENRQGSVMLRGQTLWNDGSLTILYSPKLSQHSDTNDTVPDWKATNPRDRGLIIFSQKISENFNPQWLLYLDQGNSPQLGANFSYLVNDSTIAFLEWSGGRSASLLSQATDRSESNSFRNRFSTGLTYTTSNKLSLSLEYEYNGNGLDKDQWQNLPSQSITDYIHYRQLIQTRQELPTYRAGLLYANWKDVGIKNFDISTMTRFNIDDHSHLKWFELRYRWPNDELALQWQHIYGSDLSEYGVLSTLDAWQILLRHYF